MKYIIHILLLALTSMMVSCDQTENKLLNAGTVCVKFSTAYANAPDAAAGATEAIDQINAYLCAEGVVKKLFTLDALSDLIIAEKYQFASSKLYVITNPGSCSGLNDVGEGSSDVVFSNLTLEGEISKVISYGVVDIAGNIDQSVNVALERSAARFDLDIEAGRGIEVEAIHFDGLPKGSMLFPALGDYSMRTAHSITVNATNSVEGLYYCYELPLSAGGLVATLDVKYNGTLATLLVPINEIKRNYIYNLGVRAYDGKITATLEASSMEEGDSDTGVAACKHTTIDKPQSILGSQATIISPTMVQLPNRDYQITLALTGDYDKTYDIEGNAADFEIKPDHGAIYKNSKLQIKATKNLDYYGPGRAVMLIVSHIDNAKTITDRISIVQYPPDPFPVVTIGGLEWMALNSLGVDQTHNSIVPKGESVRDFMKISSNWYKYAAPVFQWGPRATQKTFKPWDYWGVYSNVLAAYNGPITGLPASKIWEGPKLPCSEGWRLPTFEECKRIWAPNTSTLPATYTNDGITYTMTAERTGFDIYTDYITNHAYNIIISDGENELVFPAGGHRRASNYVNEEYGPNENITVSGFANRVGMTFFIWTQKPVAGKPNEIPCVGYYGSGQQPIKIALDNSSAYGLTEVNAFSYVRCVRDIDK